jgi:hypothetical protein
MPEYGNWLKVQTLRAALAAPPVDPPAEALAEVYTAARRLAQDAYTARNPEAEDLAERLLYEIHVGACYAAPAGVLPAMIWQTLLGAHLRRHLEPVRVEPFDKKDLGDRMAEAVERLGAWNHPLVGRMSRLAAAGEPFAFWCKNWYGSSTGYTYQMTAVAQRLAPESDISAYTPAIFRNLSDEIADQYSRTPHHVLRYRILERAGSSYDVPRGADDPDMLTESFALHNFRTALSTLASPMYALGSVYGVEGNWVRETPLLDAQLRQAGYDSRVVESFNVHANLDQKHTQEWLEMVLAIPLTPEQTAQVLMGCIAGLEVRRRMYDAVDARLTAKAA